MTFLVLKIYLEDTVFIRKKNENLIIISIKSLNNDLINEPNKIAITSSELVLILLISINSNL